MPTFQEYLLHHLQLRSSFLPCFFLTKVDALMSREHYRPINPLLRMSHANINLMLTTINLFITRLILLRRRSRGNFVANFFYEIPVVCGDWITGVNQAIGLCSNRNAKR